MAGKIGVVTHYYDRIGVASVKLSALFRVGDKIKVKGKNSELNQDVVSIQLEHNNVDKGKKGQEIGLKVNQPVKENDVVYKVT